MRRLELPLSYSQGFHPKPDMTFGPALSLGVASLCETVDVKIAADLDPSQILGELSAGAQAGLRFVGGSSLGPGDAGISRIVDVARYVVGIARAGLGPYADPAWLQERIDTAFDGRELSVVRRIDGIGKRVDVRDYLRQVVLGDEEASLVLARAGIVGDMHALSVEVDIRGSGGVKIAEVVEALFGADVPHRAVRFLLGRRLPAGGIATPLELASLRGPSPAAPN
jgi:radical SAM-linked protein